MRRHILTIVLLLFGSAGAALSETVELPDGRSYVIDLPPRATGAPMILALHGGGGNPAQFRRSSGLSGPATRQGFAVIYPAGTTRGRLNLLTWYGAYCCGHAARSNSDDIAFLDAVVADAAARFSLDRQAVCVTGMSNGSIMAETYAAARPDRVKAAAGVAGTMDVAGVKVTGPVPLLIIHGTADTHVPYQGGIGPEGLTETDFSSVSDVAEACAAAETRTLRIKRYALFPGLEGERVLAEDRVTASGHLVLRVLTVEGGGHEWPGARRFGRQRFDANSEIVAFFSQHR